MKVQLHKFYTSAIDRSGWWVSRFDSSTLTQKVCSTYSTRAWVGSRVSCFTDWLTLIIIKFSLQHLQYISTYIIIFFWNCVTAGGIVTYSILCYIYQLTGFNLKIFWKEHNFHFLKNAWNYIERPGKTIN